MSKKAGQKQRTKAAETGDNALLQQIMDTASVAIFLVDKAGRITHANRRMAEMFGRSLEELAGCEYVELVHPEEREIGRQKMLALLASELQSVDLERRYWRKDGSEFWGHLAGRRFHDDQGNERGLIGVIEDITERRRTEEKLRESESLFRALFENVNVVALVIDPSDGSILDANEAAAVFYGWTRSQLRSMNISQINTLTPAEVKARMDEAKGNAQTFFSFRHGRADGSVRDVEVYSGPLQFQGRTALYSIIHDVTERRHAERRLQESEEMLKQSQWIGRIGHYTLDVASGRWTSSEVLNDIFGISPQFERTVDGWLQLIHPGDRERMAAYFQDEVLLQRKPFDREYRIRRLSDGAERWVHGRGTLETDQAGRLTRMFGIIQDITDRKQADAALRASEEKYRRLYNETPVLLHSIDRNAVVVEVNDHWLKTMGYERREVIGRKVTDFYSAASKKYAEEVVQPAFFRDGIVTDVAYQFVKKSGELVDVLLSATGERDAEGRVVRSQAVILDITERKQAEVRLLKSERMLQTIIEAEPECVKVLDENACLIMMNRAGLDMIQADSLEQVKGQCVCPMVTSAYRQEFLDLTKRVFQGGSGTMVFEMVGMRGRHMWLETHAVPLRDERDEIIAVLGVTRDITAHKLADEALREKEHKYRLLFESAYDGIFTLDETGFTDCNQRGADMYGLSREQLIGRMPVALSPEFQPDGRRSADVSEEKMRSVLAGAPQVFEWRSLRADGSPFDVEINLTRLELGGKTVLQAIVRDISERKRADEERRRRTERMISLYRISQQTRQDEQAFLDLALNEAIALTGSSIGYLYFYDEAKREFTLNSYSSDVMKECAIAERKKCYELDRTGLWGEAVRQRRPILLNDFAAGHSLKKGYPEGHAVLRNFLTVPVIMEGMVVSVVGVANKQADYADEDITQLNLLMDSVWKMVQRTRAERALQRSEERFRSIIENATAGILVADVQTRGIRYVNPELCRMLGYSAQELMAMTVFDLAVPEEAEASAAGFLAHAKGTIRMTERTFRRKDGSRCRVSINSVPMEFDGKTSLVGFFSDVTERHLLEEERLKSQKLESIGTLAGGIAHDFNNLLQGVFGYISMAKLTHDQKEKSLAMLTQAEKALHQSVNLTTQLLTFSKGGKPVRTVTDLRPVIEDAARFALSGTRVVSVLSLAGDLRPVEADGGQIGQVIQNIVLNAEQAMPLGGTIGISARNMPAGARAGLPAHLAGDLVEITIRDQGTGIPLEHLSKIFDPYFTTKEKGSGLGLATAYSIVNNHDGLITVSSELGRGSVFTILLPASDRKLRTAAAPEAPKAARRSRILVMDDEEIVRMVMFELLTGLGHDVELTGNGGEAIERYRQALAAGRPFDVVILDLTVRGGMGGAETMRKLRELDPGAKGIVSSGYSEDSVVANYREHGFAAFLKKPYNLAGLQATLNELIG